MLHLTCHNESSNIQLDQSRAERTGTDPRDFFLPHTYLPLLAKLSRADDNPPATACIAQCTHTDLSFRNYTILYYMSGQLSLTSALI